MWNITNTFQIDDKPVGQIPTARVAFVKSVNVTYIAGTVKPQIVVSLLKHSNAKIIQNS
jgi:hypothetical protein